jgi:hypothetical protein
MTGRLDPDARFAGKQLPVSRFAGDDGAADPRVREALADHAAGAVGIEVVQRALVDARLLIPAAAGLDRSARDARTGQRVDAESHLAVVDLVSPAGWRGLIAFTGLDSVRTWDPQARPVPTTAQEAARSAREDGRSVLVLDPAGPHRAALTGWPLLALAAGRLAFAPFEDDEVRDAVLAVALRVEGVTGLKVLPPVDDSGDALVLLRLGADGPPVPAVLGRVAEGLRGDALLQQRCPGGLGVAVHPA